MESLIAGTPASHTHRYTSYLSKLRCEEAAYIGTRRLPGRNNADKITYWGRTRALHPSEPRKAASSIVVPDVTDEMGSSSSVDDSFSNSGESEYDKEYEEDDDDNRKWSEA